ncbi:MAG: hypothetical protein K2F59_03620, partial [Eubacteriales bacterium]|nr:hypothetical protein [Eubacteriales bacterium]
MSYCNELTENFTESFTENFAEKFIGKFGCKFNAAFAHEVKNPISLIKAHIEFLELDNNLSAYKNNINIIKKELNKISEIVSDFMLFDKNKEKFEYI